MSLAFEAPRVISPWGVKVAPLLVERTVRRTLEPDWKAV